MKKRTIALLLGIGFGIGILAGIFIVGGAAVLGSATASCDTSTTYCDPSATAGGFSILIMVGMLIAIAASVLNMISWIGALVKQAQNQQWAWFICTLLFGSLCTLLWLIIEPDVPRIPQFVPVYQHVQSGYQQAYPHDGPYGSVYPTDGPSYTPGQQASYYQDPYRPE